MSRVFVSVGLTLDGYMAPEGMTMEHWDTPEYRSWGAKWGALMAWILPLQHFRENLGFGPGGETGPVNDLVRGTMERIGANIMGRRMFDQGERAWPAEAPFHTPVYVLTHHPRPSLEMEGGTVFHFVDASPSEALELARDAAGGLDVRIGGGPTVVRDFLAAGLVHSAHLVQVPILLGRGVRVWDGLEGLEERYDVEAVTSPSLGVTHLNLTRRPD